MADAISAKTAWALAKAIKGGSKKKLPNSGNATVVRVDQDGTHWVRISGSDVETPVNGAITADARLGDVVQYHLEDTRISITGNATSPSVGKEYVDERIEPVEAKVDIVAKANALLNTATERARSVADAAKSVADAVNQHFFADTNGVHVTEATQEDWNENHEGANVLLNATGQLFRDGLVNLLTLTTQSGARALTVWDGLGNTAANVRAIIGEVIQLGKAGESHAMLDYHSMQLVDKEGNTYFHVSDLRDESGYATVTESFIADGTTSSYEVTLLSADGTNPTVTVDGVEVEIDLVEWPSDVSFDAPAAGALVEITYLTDDRRAKAYTLGLRRSGTYLGPSSYAEGIDTASSGIASHAEGAGTTAGQDYAHAEGNDTEASGGSAHAEGDSTHATGLCSHAEGTGTTASGMDSHAEGWFTTASGWASHASGRGTVAANKAQTVIGKYNDNKSNNAFEVGNGTDDTSRSNAFAVDWDGVVWSADDVPWTVLPLNSEFEAYNDRTVPHYCKRGGVVTVMGAVKPTAELAAQANVDIATLPEGCRPKVISYTTGHGSNARLWMCTVYEDGTVRFGRHANGTSWVSAPTSAFLGFCVTYVAGD